MDPLHKIYWLVIEKIVKIKDNDLGVSMNINRSKKIRSCGKRGQGVNILWLLWCEPGTTAPAAWHHRPGAEAMSLTQLASTLPTTQQVSQVYTGCTNE